MFFFFSDEYIKVREPDKDKLAELLLAAIGNRTRQQFAELCKVNPSTITRILQKTNKGSSSAELMCSIAENADPAAEITLDQLMEANGMAKKDDRLSSFRASQSNEKESCQVIMEEFVLRGASPRMGNIVFDVSKSLSIRPSLLLLFDGSDGLDKNLWIFEILPLYTYFDLSEKTWKIDPRRVSLIKQKVFQIISRFTFLSFKKSSTEVLDPTMFSIVTTELEVYKVIVEEFGDMAVPANISIIYIDTAEGGVKTEYIMNRTDGNDRDSFFMNTPIIKNENEVNRIYIGKNDGMEDNEC